MKTQTSLVFAIALVFTTISYSATPQLISYQGRLTDGSGTPLAGTYSVQFTIYDALNTSPLWDETQSVTTGADGLFTVILGSITALTDDRFEDQARYLGIKIGSDPELSPRARLTSVPYAMRANTVDGASGGKLTSPIRIGQSLAVTSAGVNSNSATSYGGYFQSTWADNASHALHGEYVGGGNVDAVGVYGRSIPVPNWGIGGDFEGGYIGVRGSVANASLFGTGVAGYSTGTGTTSNYGVSGWAEGGSENIGILGVAVEGADQFGVAVYGKVVPTAGGTLWAGYFNGWVNVVGQLLKGGGAFRIDHPLDPENKYLQHSFVESPDMKNIYDGVVILDQGGKATVTLPDWFGALNRDFRYQLTCIGGYAPVYVSQKMTDNAFKISGGSPELEVSWQVTGIRQDAFANANRIEVEVPKNADRVGTYLYPEAFGLSRELGENFKREKAMVRRDEVRNNR